MVVSLVPRGDAQKARTHCIRDHEFTPENTRVDNKGHRVCKACNRISAAKWRANNPDKVHEFYRRRRVKILKWLDEYKLSQGCVDCGYVEHPDALEFDHVDPLLKSYHVSRNATMASVLRELKKCEVRCANCHNIRTRQQQRAFWAGKRKRAVEVRG